MRVPGVNLLAIASRAIGFQRVTWHPWHSRGEDALGRFVSLFNEPVVIRGSWQPVQRDRYERQGLDLTRKYYNFFTSNPMRGIEPDRGTDIIDYRSRRHEVVDVTPWDQEDGWSHVLVVDVGDTSEALPIAPENNNE